MSDIYTLSTHQRIKLLFSISSNSPIAIQKDKTSIYTMEHINIFLDGHFNPLLKVLGNFHKLLSAFSSISHLGSHGVQASLDKLSSSPHPHWVLFEAILFGQGVRAHRLSFHITTSLVISINIKYLRHADFETLPRWLYFRW